MGHYDISGADARYREMIKLEKIQRKLENPSVWCILEDEFNARMTRKLDAVLCEQYGLTKGYFMRLQREYDKLEKGK